MASFGRSGEILLSRAAAVSKLGKSIPFKLNAQMKNANIFVDVDLTLVDAKGNLLEGAKEALVKLKDKGCHLFLWSSVGMEYAKKVAALHRLTDLFEGYASKPDIIIDDMPNTAVAPFVFDVNQESSWVAMADRIITKHVD